MVASQSTANSTNSPTRPPYLSPAILQRGFGFVVFEEKAGAQAAVDALDGNDVDGRTVRVEFFTPKPRTERREQQPRRNFGRGQDGAFHSWPYPKLSLRLKLACVINGPHWRIAPFHTTPGP